MNTGRIITTALAASILAIPAMAEAPGYFKVPGTESTLKVYGFAEMRYNYGFTGFQDVSDLDGNAGYDQTVLRKGISSTDVRGRIGITSTTPSSFGDINVKVEAEAKSEDGTVDGAMKLRHAYGEMAGFLIGQTDTLYSTWHNGPGALWGFISDFNAPGKARQVRYTLTPTKEIKIGFSLEQDYSGNKTPSTGGTKTPSVVGAFQYGADWGNVTASIGYQKKSDWTMAAPTATTVSKAGTSFAVSGAWNITANDSLTACINNAGGHFGTASDGFMDDASTVATDLHFYKTTAMNLGYSHKWSDAFSSAVGVGRVTWKKSTKRSGNLHDHKANLTEFFVNSTWNATKTTKFAAEFMTGKTKFSGINAYRDKNGAAKSSLKDSQIHVQAIFNFF